MPSPPNLLFGTGTLRNVTPSAGLAMLAVLRAHGVVHIDTARMYGSTLDGRLGNTERQLRGLGVGEGEGGGYQDRGGGVGRGGGGRSGRASLVDLGVGQVRIMYLHGPDRETPLEETCREMDELYRAGVFKQFGISNYTAEEVERIVEICKANDYVPPTVYQGTYSALARHAETKLLPTLRAHGIAFFAYSTLAAGMLSGKYVQGGEAEKGSRGDPQSFTGKNMEATFFRPALFEAVDILKTHLSALPSPAPSPAEFSTRWTAYHSAIDASLGDAIVLGARDAAQLEEVLRWVEAGPLTEVELGEGRGAVMERVWERAQGEAPGYSR